MLGTIMYQQTTLLSAFLLALRFRFLGRVQNLPAWKIGHHRVAHRKIFHRTNWLDEELHVVVIVIVVAQ